MSNLPYVYKIQIYCPVRNIKCAYHSRIKFFVIVMCIFLLSIQCITLYILCIHTVHSIKVLITVLMQFFCAFSPCCVHIFLHKREIVTVFSLIISACYLRCNSAMTWGYYAVFFFWILFEIHFGNTKAHLSSVGLRPWAIAHTSLQKKAPRYFLII